MGNPAGAELGLTAVPLWRRVVHDDFRPLHNSLGKWRHRADSGLGRATARSQHIYQQPGSCCSASLTCKIHTKLRAGSSASGFDLGPSKGPQGLIMTNHFSGLFYWMWWFWRRLHAREQRQACLTYQAQGATRFLTPKCPLNWHFSPVHSSRLDSLAKICLLWWTISSGRAGTLSDVSMAVPQASSTLCGQ